MTKKLYRNLKAWGKKERLLSSRGNRLELILFYLLLFFLPTQLGKHFFPAQSLVLGIRVDYLSPTIYFTDILIGLLLAFSLVRIISNIQFSRLSGIPQWRGQISNFKLLDIGIYWKYVVLVVFLASNIFFSQNLFVSLYGGIKLLEFIFLGWYVKEKWNIFNKHIVAAILGLTIIYESTLAILQFFNHGSLNGIWYFLGERSFTSTTPGIANTSLNGVLILRPYATFPHPNVLAGYITIVLAVVISNIKFPISNFKKIFFSITFILGSIAIFLSLSRSAIFCYLILLIFLLYKKFLMKKQTAVKIITLVAATLCMFGIIFLSPLGSRFIIAISDESIVERQILLQSAWNMSLAHPLFGVGLQNFIPALPSFEKTQTLIPLLQPVHNIFFLIASETGIIGLLIFLYFLFKTMSYIRHSGERSDSRISKRCGLVQHDEQETSQDDATCKVNFKFQILTVFLILGLFDHYFLTLQQGQLLTAFVFGIAWAKPRTVWYRAKKKNMLL